MRSRIKSGAAGTTLVEVLIAISLLSVLSVGILFAMRTGLTSLSKANTKLMDNRRVAGAQRVLEQQIANMVPAAGGCPMEPGNPRALGPKLPYFQGEPQSMRFVSTYSLEGAARGASQILEYQVIPGEGGRGVRLIVNEIPWGGMVSLSATCMGMVTDPETGAAMPAFLPIEARPSSFVLADKLAYCRFSYLAAMPPPVYQMWRPRWSARQMWPRAVRIDMAPLEEDASRLRPTAITAAIHVTRPLEIPDAVQ